MRFSNRPRSHSERFHSSIRHRNKETRTTVAAMRKVSETLTTVLCGGGGGVRRAKRTRCEWLLQLQGEQGTGGVKGGHPYLLQVPCGKRNGCLDPRTSRSHLKHLTRVALRRVARRTLGHRRKVGHGAEALMQPNEA